MSAKKLFGREWSNKADYANTEDFTASQWAWEFLRRNPEYATDWDWFNTTWLALEFEYGKPPNRDFNRWQQDPRAHRVNDFQPSEEPENLLIECWMGSRWGFYVFPQSPSEEEPPPWREPEEVVTLLDGSEAEYFTANSGHIALGFDIHQPIEKQVEYCQRMLRILQRQAEQSGQMVVRNIASQSQQWRVYLRLLDAQISGASEKEIALAFGKIDIEKSYAIAQRLCAVGYLAIAALEINTGDQHEKK